MPLAISGTVYDGFGQRFSKQNPGSNPIFYIYDQSVTLLEETDGHGLLNDYVYLNGNPVGEITGGKVYYLHADRHGTPQLVTDGSQTVAWGTTYQPFGTTTTPIGTITQNLRFPGQYADSETGWSQNHFRDYSPVLGRYLETDPLGFVAGLNSYMYSGANPLLNTDFWGLCSQEDYKKFQELLKAYERANAVAATIENTNKASEDLAKYQNNVANYQQLVNATNSGDPEAAVDALNKGTGKSLLNISFNSFSFGMDSAKAAGAANGIIP